AGGLRGDRGPRMPQRRAHQRLAGGGSVEQLIGVLPSPAGRRLPLREEFSLLAAGHARTEGAMRESRVRLGLAAALAVALLSAGPGAATPILGVARSPERLTAASRTAAVTIPFDRAVDHASITPSSFRVFGKQSGTATGPFTFSPDDTAVTLT